LQHNLLLMVQTRLGCLKRLHEMLRCVVWSDAVVRCQTRPVPVADSTWLCSERMYAPGRWHGE
jgi:hypothetical protein